MCSMMFKKRKNIEKNIFWNAQHNLRKEGLMLTWYFLHMLIDTDV